MLFFGSCYSSVWKEILVEFGLKLELYVDMLIYLVNAVGLTPGGSSTVHI